MTDKPASFSIETASVTDRGLNERRPHNEDAFLNEPSLKIFAVADGVGGAEAGEVASKTAIEILDEAFRHHAEGDDAEDLLEIAIQRANNSIFRMSREQPRFSMMATTIVALHLDGLHATIGHVGDSRLYRIDPDGSIHRETEDHSLVEEEVRAGRMTAQQAANHPSRNIISRALGAEASVEVDTKTLDVEPGTTFLLCSDGITRHIEDAEIASVVSNASNLESACDELKRLCFERGAEDNLTAVLVRVGVPPGASPAGDDERTIIAERPQISGEAASVLARPFDDGRIEAVEPSNSSGEDETLRTDAMKTDTSNHSNKVERRSSAGTILAVLFFVLAAAGASFFGGMLYERRNAPRVVAGPLATPTPFPTVETENPASSFDEARRAVDLSPSAEAARMAASMNNQPLSSNDPEFLYLYGRALLLSDRQQEAALAFERAIQQAEQNMTPRNAQLKIDSRLAQVAAYLRGNDPAQARAAADALGEMIRPSTTGAPPNSQPSPAVTPF